MKPVAGRLYTHPARCKMRTTKTACLVMCSREKLTTHSVAEHLYTSKRFVADRHVASANYGEWRIVSGKFGIISPSFIIGPYNVDLNRAKTDFLDSWVDCVCRQLEDWFLDENVELGIRATGVYLESTLLALDKLGFARDPRNETDRYGSTRRIRGI